MPGSAPSPRAETDLELQEDVGLGSQYPGTLCTSSTAARSVVSSAPRPLGLFFMNMS